MQNRGTARTFKDYGELVFAPYISAQLDKCSRVDLVWDGYVLASLKASTRQKRGKGTRKRVAASTVMPKNWKTFYVSMRTKLNCVRSSHPKLFAFTRYCWQIGRNCMQQTEVLLTHAWPALLHVRKRRRTLVYLCMRQMLCKRSVRRWPYALLILMYWYWMRLHLARQVLMSVGLPLASGQTISTWLPMKWLPQ